MAKEATPRAVGLSQDRAAEMEAEKEGAKHPVNVQYRNLLFLKSTRK